MRRGSRGETTQSAAKEVKRIVHASSFDLQTCVKRSLNLYQHTVHLQHVQQSCFTAGDPPFATLARIERTDNLAAHSDNTASSDYTSQRPAHA